MMGECHVCEDEPSGKVQMHDNFHTLCKVSSALLDFAGLAQQKETPQILFEHLLDPVGMKRVVFGLPLWCCPNQYLLLDLQENVFKVWSLGKLYNFMSSKMLIFFPCNRYTDDFIGQ